MEREPWDSPLDDEQSSTEQESATSYLKTSQELNYHLQIIKVENTKC